DRAAVVVDAPQVVAGACDVRRSRPVGPLALAERREGAVEGQDVEAELRELELADDLRARQAEGVARGREPEAGDDLLADGRPADHAPAPQDARLPPRAGELGGGDEPVVAAADDHRVVALRHPTPPCVAAGRPGAARAPRPASR